MPDREGRARASRGPCRPARSRRARRPSASASRPSTPACPRPAWPGWWCGCGRGRRCRSRSVVSSSYAVTVVVSRRQVRQYGLNGNRSSSVLPSTSSSSATESASASASWSDAVLGCCLLGPVAGEHRLDVVAVPDGEEHLLAVEAGLVALGLRDLLHLDAHRVQGVEQRLLEVLGPRGVAVPRVGYGAQRAADVLGVRRVDARGHLAEPVVVVPHVQVPHRHPAAAQLVGDEVHGDELAHVAQVHPSRRRDPRRDGHPLALAGVPDGVVGGAGDPVGRGGWTWAETHRPRHATARATRTS